MLRDEGLELFSHYSQHRWSSLEVLLCLDVKSRNKEKLIIDLCVFGCGDVSCLN